MRDIFNELADGAARDPMTAAREAMRTPLPKRFYTDASAVPDGDAFVVHLDGRAARTPGKALIQLPTQAAAQLVADEFAAQGEQIDPAKMPAFRLTNTAIDGVAADPQAVIEDVIRFFGSDLLCYRADGPEALINAQSAKWDDPLEWAETLAGARFSLAKGVMHVTQPRETLAALGAVVGQVREPVALAALHSMTTLTGSAILALGTFRGEWTPEDAWSAAHVDEDFNIAQWGEDAEAKANRARRWTEMTAAAQMAQAVRGGD